MAQTPLPRYLRKDFQDFSGGLNTQDANLRVAHNQFTQLDNAVVNDRGLLEKARGYGLDGSPFPDETTAFIRMLHNYRRGSTVDKLMVAAADSGNANATYKVDIKETAGDSVYDYIGYTTGTATFTNGSANVTAGTGTAFTTHLKAGDKIKPTATAVWYEISAVTGAGTLTLSSNFAEATQTGSAFKARIILHKDFIPVAVTFNNNLIVSNGSESMISYNNTTATLITDTDAPKGKFLETHKQRLFSAATASGPSSIYWSAVNNEAVWDATSLEVVFANDNGNICGIKSFADSLLVFKDNGNIYQVGGEFDQDDVGYAAFIRRLDTPENIGIIAGRSVAVGNDNKLYFLAESGVYYIDARLNVTKMSWQINPTIGGLVLKSTLTSNKSFVYDTKTQWDAGTHSGTIATAEGTLRQFNDQYTISNIKQGNNLAAAVIDSSNVLHAVAVADTGSATTEKLIYTKIDTDGTVTTETDFGMSTGYAGGTSIAVSSGGIVGVVGGWNLTGSDPFIYIAERHSGTAAFTSGSLVITGSGTTWSTQLNNGSKIRQSGDSVWYTVASVDSNTQVTLTAAYGGSTVAAGTFVAWTAPVSITNVQNTAETSVAFSMGYASANPRIHVITDRGDSDFKYRASGVAGAWTSVDVTTGFNSEIRYNRSSMSINGSDVYLSFTHYNTRIEAFKSTDGGGSFSRVDTFTGLVLANTDGVQGSYDASGNTLTGYSESNVIKKRNHTGGSTSTLDSTANSQCHGYTYYSSNDYACNNVGTASSQLEKYVYESNQTITSSTANILSKTYRVAQGMDNNGVVFSQCAFGASAGTLVLRRVAFRAIWTSNERSDSTLSAWGTFVLSDETTNGNTITREVALNTASPATVYASITSGSVISSDATKIYVIARLTSVIGSLSGGAQWGSLVMNFTGAGVDAKLPTGYFFANEYYLAVCESGSDANNKTLLLDRGDAFALQSYPVTCFARYKKLLYAGAASTGKVFKLLQGFNANTAAYTMTAISKEDLLGSIELEKDIYQVYIIYEVKTAGTFTFSYRLDNFVNPAGSTWSDTTVTQTGVGIAEVLIGNKARSIQFKVSNATANNEVSIVGYVVLYHYLNVR